MALNPLNPHYSMENPASIYDEEAMTALELAGRTAGKVNEVVEAQNKLQEDTDETMAQVRERLDNQDDKLEEFQDETIPAEVDKGINHHVSTGTFDRAISKYANNLEQRVDNLLANIPEGGTTMDAEVVDIRMDERGHVHTSAGASVREQTERTQAQLTNANNNHGVYVMPLVWAKSSAGTHFVSEPCPVPVDGLSLCISEFGPYMCNGKEAKLIARMRLGHMVEGTFTEDADLTKVYGLSVYSNRVKFVPYMEGIYFRVEASLLYDSQHQMTANTIDNYAHLLDLVRPYTGKLKSGGNLLGTFPATVVTSGAGDHKYFINNGLRGLVWKYCCLATPLPLQFVDRVTCNPNIWMSAKVYKFDPVTRETTWETTKHFNSQNPCFGSECCIDFTEYGENYFANMVYGYVPTGAEYDATAYADKTLAPVNVTTCGLNNRRLTNGVHVEWNTETRRIDTACGGNPVVQRNIELLKTLKHKTVPGKYGHDNSSDTFYILGQDDFAGAYYGGAYSRGALFFNVSPATYYASLLNPNSNAYGDNNTAECGARYGLQCSNFITLCHGYPLPLSTFDYRYNETIPFFDRKPLNLHTDIDDIRVYDIMTQGAGETGHTVMVTGVGNIGDIFPFINILESRTPSTMENLYVLHNGPGFYKSDSEGWYVNNYTFMNTTHPEYDQPIHNRANWLAPYTEPQKVMCSRGYGSVYVLGKNKVVLSVAEDVTEVTITQDGTVLGTYNVADMSTGNQNGYQLMDITSNVGAGTIRVHNNVDDSVEEFHIIDASGYTVTAILNDDKVIVHTNKPSEVKYVNLLYKFKDGDHIGELTNMNFMPDFDSNGNMELPAYVDTDIGYVDLASSGDVWEDRVNVVFNTAYDTNTFAVDAQGDAFN